jgi:LytS/YehU family sensor histidine kinase
MALDLIKATALILALSLLQGFNTRFWKENQSASDLCSGLIFGGMCVVGMLMPITLAPGLIFDGRSAVLAMASLFGGPLVGAVAGLIAAAHRLSIGGPGAAVGVTVIAASVLLGLGFRAAAARGQVRRGFWQFLAFGALVHGVVLIIFNWLPAAFAARIYHELAAALHADAGTCHGAARHAAAGSRATNGNGTCAAQQRGAHACHHGSHPGCTDGA